MSILQTIKQCVLSQSGSGGSAGGRGVSYDGKGLPNGEPPLSHLFMYYLLFSFFFSLSLPLPPQKGGKMNGNREPMENRLMWHSTARGGFQKMYAASFHRLLL